MALLRFGVFEFDLDTHELWTAGERVRLQEQPSHVLSALLENAGRVVTREELRHRVWPDNTFVDFDHSLNIAVNKIREALDDQATNPSFVETVPRRGYRFLPPIELVRNRARTDWRLFAGVAGLVVISALASWAVFRPEPAFHRIAVLPLTDLNPAAGSEYFGDGLTDEIIHGLASSDGLEVRSRGSSFAFKNQPRNVRDVGRELAVDLVVEGTVLRHGDQVRVTVNLVRAADDVTTWSARYDRNLGDLATIQDDVARSIVNELRLRNVGGQRRYSANALAYNTYLQAEALAAEDAPGNERRLRQAIELLEQVIAKDPTFAPAYAGLANASAHLRNRGRSQELGKTMRAAAQKAIGLDPLWPESHAAIGMAFAADLAWPDAERAFRRAMRLGPNLSRIRRDFAVYVLLPEGKATEAREQIRKAADLDPLSVSCQIEQAFVELRSGRHREARAIAERVLAARPKDVFAGQIQARALLLEGKPNDALAILEQQGPASHGYLGYAYARVGRRNEAFRLAAEDDPARARHQVLIYAALGERWRVFDALRTLAETDDFMADLYPAEPELAALRDDPRMADFRRLRNLSQE